MRKIEKVPVSNLGEYMQVMNDNLEIGTKWAGKITRANRRVAFLSMIGIAWSAYTWKRVSDMEEKLNKVIEETENRSE